MIIGIHHIGLQVADRHEAINALGAAAPLSPLPHAGLFAGPNLYLQIDDGPRADARAPHVAGIAHLCIQSARGAETFEEMRAAGVAFIAPMTGMGGPYLYAYGHVPGGAMIELEAAPLAPADDVTRWFGHIALVTADIRRLAGFYAEWLGRDITKGGRLRNMPAVDTITGLRNVDVAACWVHGLNLGLEFWSYAEPATVAIAPDADPARFWRICFETNDLSADLARARDLGAEVLAPAREDNLALRAALRDPDGNDLHLVQWREGGSPLSLTRLPHSGILAQFAAKMSEAR